MKLKAKIQTVCIWIFITFTTIIDITNTMTCTTFIIRICIYGVICTIRPFITCITPAITVIILPIISWIISST